MVAAGGVDDSCPRGIWTSPRRPTATIFEPLITTTASGIGGAPVPSIRVPPTRAMSVSVLRAGAGRRRAQRSRRRPRAARKFRWPTRIPPSPPAPDRTRRPPWPTAIEVAARIEPERLPSPDEPRDAVALQDAAERSATWIVSMPRAVMCSVAVGHELERRRAAATEPLAHDGLLDGHGRVAAGGEGALREHGGGGAVLADPRRVAEERDVEVDGGHARRLAAEREVRGAAVGGVVERRGEGDAGAAVGEGEVGGRAGCAPPGPAVMCQVSLPIGFPILCRMNTPDGIAGDAGAAAAQCEKAGSDHVALVDDDGGEAPERLALGGRRDPVEELPEPAELHGAAEAATLEEGGAVLDLAPAECGEERGSVGGAEDGTGALPARTDGAQFFSIIARRPGLARSVSQNCIAGMSWRSRARFVTCFGCR